jgi:RNA polymerase sigma factor for flagellar operon FliA
MSNQRGITQAAYTADPSVSNAAAREQLILERMPQVRWIAANLRERLPATVLEEDLISAGVIGLIAAIDNFDPTRNTTLRTYAEHRIRGAILDSIRGLDGIPAHHRQRARQVQSAIAVAEQRLGRAPLDDEIARELKITLKEYHQTLLDVRGVSLGSLENADSQASLIRYIADREENEPGWVLERTGLQKLLTTAIENMPQVERKVIGLYFMEELTLAEIGRVLDLHTSRVSQLKQQAILRLRVVMQKRWPGRVRETNG